MLVGDSVALSMLPAARAAGGPVVNIATRFGCGTIPYEGTAEGVVLDPQEPLCGDWNKARASEIAAQPADLGVLVLGPWEQYDRWVDGAAVTFDSQRWRTLLAEDYARVLGEMAPAVGRMAVVLNHCHGAPDTGLPVEQMYQAGRYAPVVDDSARIEATNEAVRQAIKDTGLNVQVIDPSPFLCPDGFQDEIQGVPLYTDGVHFSEEGARVMWVWLAETLGIGP